MSYYVNLVPGADNKAFREKMEERLGSDLNMTIDIASVIEGSAGYAALFPRRLQKRRLRPGGHIYAGIRRLPYNQVDKGRHVHNDILHHQHREHHHQRKHQHGDAHRDVLLHPGKAGLQRKGQLQRSPRPLISSNVINYIQENMKNLGAMKAIGYRSGQIVAGLLVQFLGVYREAETIS